MQFAVIFQIHLKSNSNLAGLAEKHGPNSEHLTYLRNTSSKWSLPSWTHTLLSCRNLLLQIFKHDAKATATIFLIFLRAWKSLNLYFLSKLAFRHDKFVDTSAYLMLSDPGSFTEATNTPKTVGSGVCKFGGRGGRNFPKLISYE